MPALSVEGGKREEIRIRYEGEFSYLMLNGEDKGQVEKHIVLEEKISAPIKEGQKVGSLNYVMHGKPIGSVDIVADESVEKAGFWDYFNWVWKGFCLVKAVRE